MKKTILILTVLLSNFLNAQETIRSYSFEITRPTNTTTYTSLDAISNSSTTPVVITFADISAGYNNFISYIVSGVKIATDQTTNTARYRLHLYTSTPTAINDNDPYTSLYVNKNIKIGVVDLPACNTEGTGGTQSVSQNFDVRIPFVLTGNTIYGLLETLDSFTPVSGQKFFLSITIVTVR